MTKTEALRRARAQLAFGYYRVSAVLVEVRCPIDRDHRVSREVRAWATTSQRVAALREALVEHLMDEHALDEVAEGHRPRDWFLSGRYPWCSCGFAPRDNALLVAHWAELGLAWRDDHGWLTWERVVASA